MNPLQEIGGKIIKEQELVIGPLAWSEARKVAGLRVVDQAMGVVEFAGNDPKRAIDDLVARYERLFGGASHEVCREAAASIIANMSAADIPTSLR